VPERELVGRPPIPVPFLLAAKLSFVVCWGFPLVNALGVVSTAVELPLMRGAGFVVMFTGIIVVVAAMANLGGSLAVGLPGNPAGLRTAGLYRYSRNPIYLGALLVCAGSCLFIPHVFNVLSFLTAAVLHSWIIRREECYLETAYGDAWRAYARRVPRWAGLRRPP
jgi:protein-S-isoprenylcysteine O-methyltransferase Ste14